ncbi:MAG: hypothetical protein O3A13_09330, partial [Proteobacteria bacterium]|nr:hypothetical protein [Pseudomonadota bacterium]
TNHFNLIRRLFQFSQTLLSSIARLNDELNTTYVAFGKDGDDYKANQVAQDVNAAEMSMPSVASRTVAKAGRLYRNSDWDLLDALESGADLGEMDPADLPEPMKSLSEEEREEYVGQLAAKRESVSREIEELGKKRQVFIAEERARLSGIGETGLDKAILNGVRTLAEQKGFEFSQ